MEKLSGDYIAGFVDGEGCFALKFIRDIKHDRKNRPAYFYWRLEFAIVLKGDKEILEAIKNTLTCGKVYPADRRGMVRYSVQNLPDLLNKVIPFFEKYPLQAKKRFDFELWREAAFLFARNQREGVNTELGKSGFQRSDWRSSDLSKLKEIYEQMKTYKGGTHSLKWAREAVS